MLAPDDSRALARAFQIGLFNWTERQRANQIADSVASASELPSWITERMRKATATMTDIREEK